MVKIKVSIIIPTYNRGELLLEALASVENQSLQEWECIIVDDGSSDETPIFMKSLVNSDHRFRYFRRPQNLPKGASSCRNYGFEKSKGRYIQWLDDDDLLSEHKLELQVDHLETFKNNKIFTTCDWDLLWPGKIFEKRNLLSSKEYLNAQRFFHELRNQQTFLPIHSFLFPKDLILKSGLWNVHLTLNDDAEYITRIILNSDRLVNTEGCYVLYREHEKDRISRQKGKRNLASFILSLRIMHAHLKFANIEGKAFFKMKLLRIFHRHWSTDPESLKCHFFFFKENGIDLNYAFYYQLKHSLYKKLYPRYKRLKIKENYP